MMYWEGIVELRDGTEIRKQYKYNAAGNYYQECEEQYAAECDLLEGLENPQEVVFYTVNLIEK